MYWNTHTVLYIVHCTEILTCICWTKHYTHNFIEDKNMWLSYETTNRSQIDFQRYDDFKNMVKWLIHLKQSSFSGYISQISWWLLWYRLLLFYLVSLHSLSYYLWGEDNIMLSGWKIKMRRYCLMHDVDKFMFFDEANKDSV